MVFPLVTCVHLIRCPMNFKTHLHPSAQKDWHKLQFHQATRLVTNFTLTRGLTKNVGMNVPRALM
jgi:hypothetical protein